MAKDRVVLDTCVVLHMIDYNEIYTNSGKQAFETKLKEDEEKYEKIKQDISSLMSPKFKEQNKQYSFENQLFLYDKYIKENIVKFDEYTYRLKKLTQGILVDKDDIKKEQPIFLSDERIQQIQNEIQNRKVKREKILNHKANFTKKYKEMGTIHQPLYAGKLLKEKLDGNLNFYLVDDGYREIKHHIKTEKETNQNFKTYDEQKIQNVLKNCTLLSARNFVTTKIADNLAMLYRQSIDGSTPMAEDLNSLKTYGDSLIMAESSLTGINLITFNGKDFVFDRNNGINEDIRNHVKKVNSLNPNLTSEALAYSPLEYFEGKCPKLNPKNITADFKFADAYNDQRGYFKY